MGIVLPLMNVKNSTPERLCQRKATRHPPSHLFQAPDNKTVIWNTLWNSVTPNHKLPSNHRIYPSPAPWAEVHCLMYQVWSSIPIYVMANHTNTKSSIQQSSEQQNNGKFPVGHMSYPHLGSPQPSLNFQLSQNTSFRSIVLG